MLRPFTILALLVVGVLLTLVLVVLAGLLSFGVELLAVASLWVDGLWAAAPPEVIPILVADVLCLLLAASYWMAQRVRRVPARRSHEKRVIAFY